MYHYDLRITTLNLSVDVLNSLKQIKPEENLTYNFTVADGLVEKDFLRSDVYIYRGQVTAETIEYFKAIKEKTEVYIILCTEAKKLEPNALELVDELWPMDELPALYAGLFAKYMHFLKLMLDKELTESYLDSLIDNMPDMVWFKDKRGAHLKVNKKFCDVVGKSKEDIKGRGHCYIWDLDPQEYAEGEYICMETEFPVLEQGKSFMFEETVKYGDTLHYLNTYKSPVYDHHHQVIGTVGFARDITEVWTSRGELKLILDNLPSPCVLYDAGMVATACNLAFLKTFHLREEEVIGKHGMEDISSIIPHASLKEKVELDPDTIKFNFERTVNGEEHFMRGMAHKLRSTKGELQGMLLLLTDLSDDKKNFDKVYSLSITDELTGCFNRTYYREKLDNLVGNNIPFSLGYIDIDRLKQVNDNFGHEAGDEYITHAAGLMKDILGHNAQICRIGGDEFAVIAEFLNEEQIEAAMRRVAEGLKTLDLKYPVGISFGTGYINTHDFTDFRRMAADIDQKLYAMKKGKHIES